MDPKNPRLYAATSGFGVASWDLTYDRLIPAVASLHGIAPTYFHSDASIFNASSSKTVPVKATYRCFSGSCGEAVVTLAVPPRQELSVSDIATSVFGAAESGGPVELESAEPISVTSRLYTPTLPAPTTGMFVPGLDPADAAPTQILLLLSHSADRSTGSRTNVGAFNPTDEDQDLTFRFFEAEAQRSAVSAATWAPARRFRSMTLTSLRHSASRAISRRSTPCVEVTNRRRFLPMQRSSTTARRISSSFGAASSDRSSATPSQRTIS